MRMRPLTPDENRAAIQTLANRGARKRHAKVLQRRLQAWQREQRCNSHGLADVAPGVIAAIRAELALR